MKNEKLANDSKIQSSVWRNTSMVDTILFASEFLENRLNQRLFNIESIRKRTAMFQANGQINGSLVIYQAYKNGLMGVCI